jgi:hypothetical protein
MHTIDVSTETLDNIHGLQTALQKILRKRLVSIDQTLKVLFATGNVQQVLSDMILEEAPLH